MRCRASMVSNEQAEENQGGGSLYCVSERDLERGMQVLGAEERKDELVRGGRGDERSVCSLLGRVSTGHTA